MTSEGISKNIQGYLILNWKSGQMRVAKRKPNRVGPLDIPVKIDIKVNIPPELEMVAKGEIDVPAKKVKEMFIEAI